MIRTLLVTFLVGSSPLGAAEGRRSFTPDRPLFVFEPIQPISAQPAPELDSGDKLRLALSQILSLERIAGTAAAAGLSQATDSPLQRGYGDGFDGYVKRFGSQTAFWTTKDLVGTFALASLLEHDPRYRPVSRGSFWGRAGRALSSSVVVRSRGGGHRVNTSNLGGLAAASGLSNFWHAREDRGAKETLARFGFGLAADALVRLVLELRGSSAESGDRK
jgi:hypothetical protein